MTRQTTCTSLIEDTRSGAPTITLVTDTRSERRIITGMAAIRMKQLLREMRKIFDNHQTEVQHPSCLRKAIARAAAKGVRKPKT